MYGINGAENNWWWEMICYRDRTYCNAGPLCNVLSCDRRLTDEIIKAADTAGLPICVFSGFPECFVPFFMPRDEHEPRE